MTNAFLEVGTRIQHRRHPELSGRIQALEYQLGGEVSAIPYNIQWDNNDLAYDLLGYFFIYASDESIEVEQEPDELRERGEVARHCC